jgi:hypothetical protein
MPGEAHEFITLVGGAAGNGPQFSSYALDPDSPDCRESQLRLLKGGDS